MDRPSIQACVFIVGACTLWIAIVRVNKQQQQQQPQPTQQSTLLQKRIVIENIGAFDINMFIGNVKNKLKNAR